MSQEISGPDRATLARILHLLVAVLALGGFTIELVTAAAALIPAWRASRVDPIHAMRAA